MHLRRNPVEATCTMWPKMTKIIILAYRKIGHRRWRRLASWSWRCPFQDICSWSAQLQLCCVGHSLSLRNIESPEPISQQVDGPRHTANATTVGQASLVVWNPSFNRHRHADCSDCSKATPKEPTKTCLRRQMTVEVQRFHPIMFDPCRWRTFHAAWKIFVKCSEVGQDYMCSLSQHNACIHLESRHRWRPDDCILHEKCGVTGSLGRSWTHGPVQVSKHLHLAVPTSLCSQCKPSRRDMFNSDWPLSNYGNHELKCYWTRL